MLRIRKTALLAAAVLLLATVDANVCSATEYRLIDLGHGNPNDINNSGDIVGVGTYSPGYGHAYYWGSLGSSHDIGTLGGNTSGAYAINDFGQATGMANTPDGMGALFIWDKINGMQNVPISKGSYQGNGINNSCQITGNAFLNGNYQAFLWDPVEGLTYLGTMTGNSSTAWDINSGGKVVGSSILASGAYHAYLWDSTTGMQDIGTLGGTDSFGSALNDNNVVVGVSLNSSKRRTAFIWDSSKGMRSLGSYAAGLNPLSINNNNQVVGYSYSAGAFVWSESSGIQYLASLGGETEATAINDNGWITGWSYDLEYNKHAIAWIPVPEPSSVLAILFGFVALYAKRKR